MFLVNDTMKNRRNKIEKFLRDGETVIAVLLAAANFEWTVRRAIIILGKSPTKDFTKEKGIFSGCHGLDSYKEAWRDEVSCDKGKRLSDVIRNWTFFKKQAFLLRHVLVHGAKGSVGKEFGADRVRSLIDAAEDVTKFVEVNGGDIYRKVKVRRKPRHLSAVDAQK